MIDRHSDLLRRKTDVQPALPDCRTCRWFAMLGGPSCDIRNAGMTCTNADKHEATPPVRLWRTT